MSREQRRPLVAFCAVAMVCAVIMVSALRSDAVRGFLGTGLESVQEVAAGVEIAPRPPVKAAPVARPEPAPVAVTAEVTQPVVVTPVRSSTRPDRGRPSRLGNAPGDRGPGDRGRGSHDGDRDKGDKGDKGKGHRGGKGHGSKHGDRDKGDKGKGHHGGKGHGSKHGDRDKGDKGKGHHGGKGHRGHR